jgi:hypothetical protein
VVVVVVMVVVVTAVVTIVVLVVAAPRLVVVIVQCVPLATEPGIEDIATKFEQEYVRSVRNEEECVCSVCLQCA